MLRVSIHLRGGKSLKDQLAHLKALARERHVGGATAASCEGIPTCRVFDSI
jgi:hypothetical protein